MHPNVYRSLAAPGDQSNFHTSLPYKKLNVGGKREEGVKWRHTMFRMNQLSLPIWAPTSNLQYRFEKKELGKCFCKAIALGHFDFRVDQLLA